ncbi:GIY-YIG nuclease family protein [Streptomyces pratensis]
MRTAGRRPAAWPPGALPVPVAIPRPRGRAAAVYRIYDRAGALLYVGMTTNPTSRLQAHQERSDWWPLAVSLRTEWHDTREAAEQAEARAIRSERPQANRKLNSRQFRYRSRRFHATRLHPLAWAHFGERPFSFPDVVEELGVPASTATQYGNALVEAGMFQKVGRWKAGNGYTRTYYRAVDPEECANEESLSDPDPGRPTTP